MGRHLANANLSLHEVMSTAISALDADLVNSVIDFFRAHGRTQQSQPNSDHVNVHFHFHF